MVLTHFRLIILHFDTNNGLIQVIMSLDFKYVIKSLISDSYVYTAVESWYQYYGNLKNNNHFDVNQVCTTILYFLWSQL